MATVMVRVATETRERLRRIAEREGTTLQTVVDRAVEEHERQCFWTEMDAAWDALKRNPAACQAELNERAAWDSTLVDDIDLGELWNADGSVTIRGGSSG